MAARYDRHRRSQWSAVERFETGLRHPVDRGVAVALPTGERRWWSRPRPRSSSSAKPGPGGARSGAGPPVSTVDRRSVAEPEPYVRTPRTQRHCRPSEPPETRRERKPPGVRNLRKIGFAVAAHVARGRAARHVADRADEDVGVVGEQVRSRTAAAVPAGSAASVITTAIRPPPRGPTTGPISGEEVGGSRG